MSQSQPGSARSLPIYTMVLGWLFAAACIAMAIWIPLFDRANWELTGSILYLAAGLLVAAGLVAFNRTSTRVAFALVTVGALAGAVGLVWTLVVPIVALVLIALFAQAALRGPSVAVRQAG
jgi:hypothetical protein